MSIIGSRGKKNFYLFCLRAISGAYRFALVTANKEVIGTSENYKSASGRDNGKAIVSEL